MTQNNVTRLFLPHILWNSGYQPPINNWKHKLSTHEEMVYFDDRELY